MAIFLFQILILWSTAVFLNAGTLFRGLQCRCSIRIIVQACKLFTPQPKINIIPSKFPGRCRIVDSSFRTGANNNVMGPFSDRGIIFPEARVAVAAAAGPGAARPGATGPSAAGPGTTGPSAAGPGAPTPVPCVGTGVATSAPCSGTGPWCQSLVPRF
jgi:hypothetical protein